MSINHYHPLSIIYIACDTETAKKLQRYTFNALTIKKFILMDEFSGLGRQQLEQKKLFSKLLSVKMDILKIALQFENDAIYIDCDVILCDSIIIDSEKDLILSLAYIDQSLQDSVGMFNAGYIWCSSQDFVDEWQSRLPESQYYDQHILKFIYKNYNHDFFSEQHNIMPWRLLTPSHSKEDFVRRFFVKDSSIFLGESKIKSIHTHLARKDFREFNKLLLRLMIAANDSIGLRTVDAILSTQLNYIAAMSL